MTASPERPGSGADAAHPSDADEPKVASSDERSAEADEAAPPAGADPSEEGPPQAAEPGAKKQRPLSHELPVLLVIAIALALLLKAFVVQAFYIPSGSMEQTLLIKDRVLVNKLVYRFRDVHRGEIVVFNGSGTRFPSESVIPPPKNDLQRSTRWVQRAIGEGAPRVRDFSQRV